MTDTWRALGSMQGHATVLLSGGIDSAACAYMLARRELFVQGIREFCNIKAVWIGGPGGS